MNKPILFNTEMVQAIMDGRKTVTRRVVKPQPEEGVRSGKSACGIGLFDPSGMPVCLSPYQTGNVLWVRETFNSDWCDHTIYKADGGSARDAGYSEEPKWHPSLHMPKSAARIFLRVTDVRAERLQEITDKQAQNEGVTVVTNNSGMMHRSKFVTLWNSTIKPADLDRYGWNANPYVWVISFERCEKPEDFV